MAMNTPFQINQMTFWKSKAFVDDQTLTVRQFSYPEVLVYHNYLLNILYI